MMQRINPSRTTTYEAEEAMDIVLVFVHVKPEFVEDFRQASIENARNSVQEAGVARFDVIQQADDPTRFVLVEAYYQRSDHAKHRETAHYAAWRDTVADMMAEERRAVWHTNVFPNDSGW